MLDKNNTAPLYRQLEEIIRNKVESQAWPPGYLIPSEADLITQYGVSRTTVRQALSDLVTDGILQREQGLGTFVAEPKFEHALTEGTSFTFDILQKGHRPGSITLFAEEVVPSAKIAKKLQLRTPATVIRLERIRTVDGEPVGLHAVNIVRSLVPGLEIEDLKKENFSLYEMLEGKLEAPMKEAIEAIEAGVADERKSRLLGVQAGSPILIIERITYLANGSPFECAEMVYRAERYKSVIRLHMGRGKNPVK
jgi:GntR family transcriptional regulator